MLLRFLRAVLVLTPTVVSSMVAAVLALVVIRRLVPVEALRPSNDVAGTYLQTLGTIYAVLLAFVVYVVWTQYTETCAAIEREAGDLHALVRVSDGLPPEVATAVRAATREYIDIVLGPEWDAMASAGAQPSGAAGADVGEHGSRALTALWSVLKAEEPASGTARSVYEALLERFDDVSDARTQRLTRATQRIPMPLVVLLLAGAVLTTASLALFGVDSFALHATMTASMAGAVSHVLYVIRDLDDPFRGHWVAPRAPFERVRAFIDQAAGAGDLAPDPVHASVAAPR